MVLAEGGSYKDCKLICSSSLSNPQDTAELDKQDRQTSLECRKAIFRLTAWRMQRFGRLYIL
jgi:hypothetical protein